MENKVSILIIDDETEVGEILTDILSEKYDKVEYIGQPEKAKKALSEHEYSLILSDVNMPQIQGPELMKSLRSMGFLTPVMFLTGAATKETVLTALRLGAADLIEKPFNTQELIQSIERVLELERRMAKLYLDYANREISQESIDKQKKMIGLLHVVNSKKA